jgi:hypothetical protein
MSAVSDRFSYSYEQAALCQGLGLLIPNELGDSFCKLTITSVSELDTSAIKSVAKTALSHAMYGPGSVSEKHAALRRQGISYTVSASSYGSGQNIRFP